MSQPDGPHRKRLSRDAMHVVQRCEHSLWGRSKICGALAHPRVVHDHLDQRRSTSRRWWQLLLCKRPNCRARVHLARRGGRGGRRQYRAIVRRRSVAAMCSYLRERRALQRAYN